MKRISTPPPLTCAPPVVPTGDTGDREVTITLKMALQNAEPVVYGCVEARSITSEEQNEHITDRIDEREIFDILSIIQPMLRLGN